MLYKLFIPVTESDVQLDNARWLALSEFSFYQLVSI